ncbi:tyrosine-type recombinase/integrase [Halocalculus aciditolerans]|uniref:Integrase n=1 Tax=Halocalculus aciditolerans TaxID=1383812 RepID=A0A830FI22_9EURY|nr:tyrosine-type recombinase/integrase [Halocalculus aciditolerans]GGL57198.1 integrase [Halocalculus aciditolerans]
MSSESDDPVGYFLEDMEFHGRTARTREEYERVLRSFEASVEGESVHPASVSYRECVAWVHGLRQSYAPGTVATYAGYLHRFYGYMVQVGEFEENPMALVMEEIDERIDSNPERRDIDVAGMREFVGRVRHPLHRAMVVTLLKTGMRVGELCNLDLRDVRLDGDVGEYEALGLGARPQLEGRPPSLYVASEPAAEEEYNGEVRSSSNKRKRSTVVPVDSELNEVLRAWLAVRPDARSPAEPLFARTSEAWGTRLDPSAVQRIVRGYAEDHGWYRAGADATENVTPHYFRHFFTTHLRDRTGDRGVVKYLRGDVGDDIIDTYTHNWGDRVREVYLDNVYAVL